MKEHRKIHTLINKAVNIVFWLCMTVTLWLVLQVFVFASFKIPSDSMEPGLITGDNILVWKPTVGPRIFNLFASMRNEQTEIYRIPGFKKIKRNDILVFNFPHPNSWDKLKCIYSNITSNGVSEYREIPYPSETDSFMWKAYKLPVI